MTKTFTDYNGKKGRVGSKVVAYSYLGKPYGDVKTVKDLLNRGRAGTHIYFEEGGGGRAKWYGIVKEDE